LEGNLVPQFSFKASLEGKAFLEGNLEGKPFFLEGSIVHQSPFKAFLEGNIVPQSSFKALLEAKAFFEGNLEGNIVHQSSFTAFLAGKAFLEGDIVHQFRLRALGKEILFINRF